MKRQLLKKNWQMPELPEVETLRRELERVLLGKTFAKVEVFWPKTILPLSTRSFNRRLKGRLIEAVERRAKILIFKLQGSTLGILRIEPLFLLIHLKMTGQLVYHPQGSTSKSRVEPWIVGGHPEDPSKYTRVIFCFTDNSELRFNDLRKFGWLRLLNQVTSQQLIANHGPEPLEASFNLKTFQKQLAAFPKRKLKQLLLDQTIIAGLGNIYADEVAFAAGLQPARRVGKINAEEIKKLHRAIKKILRLAIAKGGTSFRNYRRSDNTPGGFVPYLKVYGRSGKQCKQCGNLIRKVKLNGRGTHYCPQCQQ